MDIAIIGMAGRFPEAETLQAFYSNLKEGRDSIRPVSEERLKQTAIPASDRYQSMAWLDNIDQFDHAFFRISLGEARNMDPHQRIALEVVYETFENAGYNPFSFAGSETAVYAGDVYLDYYQLATELDPTLLTGNLHAVLAGRIARFFDLRGEAVMMDTSCSSSLVAVHHACLALETGGADQAIVCGIKIRIFPGEKKSVFDIGIGSEDGKTKSYSSEANGTGSGEAAGCILLKPLKKAVEDGDIIHAVIKGSAVNQDAARSGSLTAPSSIAQSQVIQKAWKKAAIDPLTITFIEGHGTATKLGDPIEVEGIDLAFSAFTDKKNACALSSVKSNIGHTDTAAGITGLIKTILSLKSGKLFPAVNFKQPNPFIDFEHSYVYVNTIFRDWEMAEGHRRRAGVSAFGLSGTNCHVVLEEAPAARIHDAGNSRQLYPIPLSGFTATALRTNITQLKAWLLKHPETSLPALSYTLCAGRFHFPFRHMVLAENISTLLSQLKENEIVTPVKQPHQLYFICSHNHHIGPQLINLMSKGNPVFATAVDTCRSALQVAGLAENDSFHIFVFQFAFYKQLEAIHISTRNFLGEGVGEIAINAITGKIDLATAIHQAVNFHETLSGDLTDKCVRFLHTIKEDDSLLMELGPVCRISAAITAHANPQSAFTGGADENAPDMLSDFVKQLFLSGYAIDWSVFFTTTDARRIELPTYAFDRVHCWIRERSDDISAKRVAAQEEVSQVTKTNIPVAHDLIQIQRIVAEAWSHVLKQEQIGEDEDFFDIGGHSLNGTQVINRLKEFLGVHLDMDDLFEYGTIADLSRFIFGRMSENEETIKTAGIEKAAVREYYPLTHSQKSFWVLDQLESGLTAYSMPGAYRIHGPLNIPAFTQAFHQLVQRHESLRTTFPTVNGEAKQQINDGSTFCLDTIDFRGMPDNESYALQQIGALAATPFDLAQGPLIKVSLFRLEEEMTLFFFSLHHIIADGWSIEVLVRDVMALYQAACTQVPPQLPALRIQFCDYAVWLEDQLNGQQLEMHREYWRNEFNNIPAVLQLPADLERPASQTFNGEKIHFRVDAQLKDALKELARNNDCTLFMTTLAAINVLLCKITGQYDMVIGSPSSGRMYPGLEDQIGLFLNVMPIRLQRTKQETFPDILQSVKSKVLQSTRHQIYPFDTLLHDLGYMKEKGHNSLFDVGFTHNTLDAVAGYGSETGEAAISDLRIEPVSHGFSAVKADLWFHLTETNDQLIVSLDYNTDLFLPATVDRFMNDLNCLFQELVVKHNSTLEALLEDIRRQELAQRKNIQFGQKQKNMDRLADIHKKVDR
jgi:3-oxoacyl-(acyl-carrier-protein) synthase/acyl carrier protein